MPQLFNRLSTAKSFVFDSANLCISSQCRSGSWARNRVDFASCHQIQAARHLIQVFLWCYTTLSATIVRRCSWLPSGDPRYLARVVSPALKYVLYNKPISWISLGDDVLHSFGKLLKIFDQVSVVLSFLGPAVVKRNVIVTQVTETWVYEYSSSIEKKGLGNIAA